MSILGINPKLLAIALALLAGVSVVIISGLGPVPGILPGSPQSATLQGTTSAVDCDDPSTLTSADIHGGADLEAGSCFVVPYGLRLQSGTTLGIGPNVRLEFGEDRGLEIASGAALVVKGGPGGNQVVFTGHDGAPWQGLEFEPQTGNSVEQSSLRGLVIENAGSRSWVGRDSLAALMIHDDAAVSMSAVTIRQSNAYGLIARQADIRAFDDVRFEGNTKIARVHPNVVGSISPSTVITANEADVIELAHPARDGVASRQTWHDHGVPYLATEGIFVREPLTLDPGVKIRFAEGTGLHVEEEGRLIAKGDTEADVILTGDQAVPGYWKGLVFRTAKDNRLEDTVVEFGGGEQWHGNADSAAMILVPDGGRVTVEDSLIRGSGHYALRAETGARLGRFANNDVRENARIARVEPNLVSAISSTNRFARNDDPHVRVSFGLSAGNPNTIEGNHDWAALGIPYLVTERTFVEGNLTLSAGAIVEFQEGLPLVVRETGRLQAWGQPDAPVVITGAASEPGFWQGMKFESDRKNLLHNAIVEYGGGQQWHGNDDSAAMLYVPDGGELKVVNSTLRRSAHYALRAEEGAGLLEGFLGITDGFAGNTVEENGWAMRIEPNLVGAIATDNAFRDNGPTDRDNVVLVAYSRTALTNNTLTGTHVWDDIGVPFRITERTTVGPSGSLFLSSGTTVEFGEDWFLIVQGQFQAVGAPGDPVVITGVERTPGYWRGIVFESDEDNVIRHAVVEYGGGEQWYGSTDSAAMLYLPPDGRVKIVDSVLRGSARYALRARQFGHLESFSGNLVEDNEWALRLDPNQVVNVTVDNVFRNNGPTERDNVIRVSYPRTAITTNTLSQTHVWRDVGVPYRISGRTSSVASWTINPGTVVEFESDMDLTIEGGTFLVKGTQSNPVVFRGARGAVGWKGLLILGGGHRFEHLELEDTGSEKWNFFQDEKSIVVGNLHTPGRLCTIEVNDATKRGAYVHWGILFFGGGDLPTETGPRGQVVPC